VAEGQGGGGFGDARLHRRALALQIFGDRRRQARVGQFMRRMRRHRAVAAQQFVLALRAGLDALQAMREREVDRLVITKLEMQEWPSSTAPQ